MIISTTPVRRHWSTMLLRRTISVALLAVPAVAQAQLPRFTLTEIPTLGGTTSFARGISTNGLVTGNAQTATGTPAPRLNAYLFDGTSSQNLGVLAGSNNFSRGYAVNSSGVVVGESDNNASRAFRWENGVMTALPTLGGATGVAHGINDAGTIVGISSTGTTSRATVWTSAGARDLGSADNTTSTLSRAWSINEQGDVVGFSRSMAGVSQATAWFGAGSAISLGSLGDGAQFSEAFASNGAQMVVGRSNTGVRTPGGTSVFSAFLWQSGSMTLLSTTGFTFSQAIDVNASGWIVGNATNVSGAPSAALLWNGGASTLLATLVNDASDWTFSSAEGINDAGQIVGYGRKNGVTRAFLLTPVPEPGAMALFAAGLLVLTGVMRRSRRRA